MLLVALASIAGSAAGAASPAPPTLRFVDLSPTVARGAHFAPGTKVRVTLVAGETKLSRVVRASSGGAFVVGFGSVPREDRCSGKVMLLASSATGQRASYRLPTMNCTTLARPDKPAIVGVDKASADTVGEASSTDSAAGVSR